MILLHRFCAHNHTHGYYHRWYRWMREKVREGKKWMVMISVMRELFGLFFMCKWSLHNSILNRVLKEVWVAIFFGQQSEVCERVPLLGRAGKTANLWFDMVHCTYKVTHILHVYWGGEICLLWCLNNCFCLTNKVFSP